MTEDWEQQKLTRDASFCLDYARDLCVGGGNSVKLQDILTKLTSCTYQQVTEDRERWFLTRIAKDHLLFIFTCLGKRLCTVTISTSLQAMATSTYHQMAEGRRWSCIIRTIMLLNAPPAFHLHVCAKDGREGGESCQVCVILTIFSLLGTWRQGGGPVLAEVVLFVLAERFPKKWSILELFWSSGWHGAFAWERVRKLNCDLRIRGGEKWH